MRSAVSNGTSLHSERPGDNRQARRFKDLVSDLSEMIGGWAALSEVQRQLLRRVAMLSIQLEALELEAAKGNKINHEEYARIAGHQRRLLGDLGLLPRPVREEADDAGDDDAPKDFRALVEQAAKEGRRLSHASGENISRRCPATSCWRSPTRASGRAGSCPSGR
ncbi:hypothetical protein AUC71_07765 [Methyloceanibacter marginalis]|uniref:Uncharacterized protein n=1 Tax=Methyloceanibacter marginalis TaxID=1774971 RepID=A0A1E3WD95_9HYPH|nr:hypothetical protein [Methyloceanibacter marginalis]ODS03793.1 hypothetical protein AUC71_07765 [Methyloceanibacter marginalis]